MKSEQSAIDQILELIPHQEPFRFIDKITYIDDSRIEGQYFFHPGQEFYKGHFPGHPITPGVILIEVMAQIGLVAFGIYLLTKTRDAGDTICSSIPVLTAVDVKFGRKVLPGEQVSVQAEKTVFRHGRLSCKVRLLNSDHRIAAEGSISGFIAEKD